MRKLKQFIFDYLRKRMPERHPRFPHLDQPLKVMIVYESDLLERNDAIKSIRQDLLRRQMDVTMWGYVEKKVINTLILPQSRILGVGDYNFFGKPRDYVLEDLQAEQDAMREKILAFLRENGTSTATDIQNALSISNQRVNGLMRPLVKSGEIIRTEDKKKAYFSVAVPESESED